MRGSVLVIAASDSSGGAGLTRDLATLTDWGVAARCAVTAVTVQTDEAWRQTHVMPTALVRAQIRAALEAGDIGAVKIGMLATAGIVTAVAESLPGRDELPIVLDPVLISSSGGRLLETEGVSQLRHTLLARVTLLTPNLPEAAELLGESVATEERGCARQLTSLLALGPAAVLLKGGHAATGAEVVDRLARPGRPMLTFAVARRSGTRRGTGCALASAIAAQLASGADLAEACRRAQAYVAGTRWPAGPVR